jgi:transcriptional/translational regulatory protein YebC/TACO1
VEEFDALMLEWVETEKRKDARDAGKTDEEIAALISRIMLSPKMGPKGIDARDRLRPHIEESLRRKLGGDLSAETVDYWLRTVLAVWES